MTEIERRAEKGKFLLVGEDAFDMPPEEYIVAENIPTLEEAMKAADEEGGEMNPVTVYDDQGKEVYRSASTE
jgi:hypothetical protein